MTRRPALRYYGAKFRLAPQIIAHFPPHQCYVEPFGGAGGVLLRKPPSPIEVYNDLDGEVVNFFRVLRDQPDALIHAIWLTPYARAEVAYAHDGPATDDPVERARRFYLISWQQFHGTKVGKSNGWRYTKHVGGGKRSPMDQWRETDHLYEIAARLRTVFIECSDAFGILRRYDGPKTLFYCDPPYLGETRYERWRSNAYAHDMSDEAQHRRLAEALHALAGKVMLSGYPSALYDDELYPDWQRIDLRGKNAQGKETTERLWIKPPTGGARTPEDCGETTRVQVQQLALDL